MVCSYQGTYLEKTDVSELACSCQGTCLEKTNVSELACSSQGTCLEKIRDIKARIFEYSCRMVYWDLLEYDWGRVVHKEPLIPAPDKNHKIYISNRYPGEVYGHCAIPSPCRDIHFL